MRPDFILPNWPAPPNVRASVTTRHGGVSTGPYTSFNLGDHVGDDPAAVVANRRVLRMHLPAEPVWLKQVHGVCCIDAAGAVVGQEADAAFSRTSGVVCAVLTADCLPVLLCDIEGKMVAAAHAGWRGLAAGVIETTVAAMGVPADRLMAWLGPAIGPQHFEVGGEVRDLFITHDPRARQAFVSRSNGTQGKWLCDIYQLAAQRLDAVGVCRLAKTDFCTVRDAAHFFSYRRDGITGRMASMIWLD